MPAQLGQLKTGQKWKVLCGAQTTMPDNEIEQSRIVHLNSKHNRVAYTCKTRSYKRNGKNRIKHRSPMQIDKSQPEGKRIMPETRVTEFPALSVDPRVEISRSASETDV